ncbi:MAG TPA: tRNA uridine-5-carboxymethylaminomethyl(34) synthesis enzyme MnmG, partial [Eubacteriaceae bacterium]|nr:tRNA uridine-5-carboxymethylaminomethyl(34) synthesis enzyme MnmG [Eubacteriaceae bacterium]
MKYEAGSYDVIVVGAGHAGCESALAAARLGFSTLLLTMNLDAIALMPCNPSIGGTGKGHLVREVDALGGEMGKNIDKTMIQTRMLNTAKGPAVHSLRAQADKFLYQKEMKKTLEHQENLDVKQHEVEELMVEREEIQGICTRTGAIFRSSKIILATGTYLKSKIIIGDITIDQGPNGLNRANKLSESMEENGIALLRFKTGTPARIHRKSVDFSKMIRQDGDLEIVPFSFETEEINRDQVPCYLTYTNENTHKIIEENLHLSPLFSGNITGVGARYCPSIEDKVVRFKDKPKHQIFIEPEGLDTEELYVQGLSSSLPEKVQIEVMRTIEGLEKAEIMRSAYAIEYDNINPIHLQLSLESKQVKGLYCAGQINGTSGYEEAAAQGLIAGINACRALKGQDPLVLDRSEAYIGVLIDDIVTKGTLEPYRMMTSRAEYRLLLRQDNADLRLTPKGYQIGLISEERYQNFIQKCQDIEQEKTRLRETMVKPDEDVVQFLKNNNSAPIDKGVSLETLLKRPELNYEKIKDIDPHRPKRMKDAA